MLLTLHRGIFQFFKTLERQKRKESLYRSNYYDLKICHFFIINIFLSSKEILLCVFFFNITLFGFFQRKGLVGLGLLTEDNAELVATGGNMEGGVAQGFNVSPMFPLAPPLFCVGVPVTPPNISENSNPLRFVIQIHLHELP